MTLSFAFWTRAALDRRTRTSLRAALPPSSKWWLTQPYLVGLWGTQLLFVPGIAGDPSPLTKSATTRREMVAYLTRMTGFIDEPQIRSEVQSQLVRLAYIGADTIRAQELLNQMLVETPNYPFTRLIASRYAPNRPLREGAALPAFNFASLPDTTSRITNATITGKFTLIDFWGTWCGPCLAAMPELHRIYQLYRHRGFEILSVAADESPEVVNKFRAGKWPMPWLNAFARYSEGVEENRQLQELGILIFPRAVLVDPQGKIAAVLGAEMEELALTLDRLLAGSDIR
jgi:thiol-disulfide isomerase/thioredoxin